MIRRFALLAATAAVAASSACGGSGVDRNQPVTTPTGGVPATRPAPQPEMLLRAYLDGVRVPVVALRPGAVRAIAALRAQTREPTAQEATDALVAARAASRAFRRNAAVLRRVPAVVSLRGAHNALVESSGLAARGLRRLSRGLSGWLSSPGHTGRRMLQLASHRALAWEGALRTACAAQGIPPPRWLGRPAQWTQALLHAAQTDLTMSLGSGSAGVAVAALQDRLATLGYLPRGYATDAYDYRTLQAVVAFQGWEGLARDGVAGPITLARLRTASRPRAWSTATRHMELHKQQQVLLLVDGGAVERAIHVSTAAPGHVTPAGTFTIFRKEMMSWSVPFQVWMPYASYFSGGYALHEYPDVPAYPASHGCVRVPAGDSLVVWEFATLGTPITIG